MVIKLRLHTFRTEFMLGSPAGTGPGAQGLPGGRSRTAGPPKQQGTIDTGGRLDPEGPHSVMILPQVHLRKPCYDFYFL